MRLIGSVWKANGQKLCTHSGIRRRRLAGSAAAQESPPYSVSVHPSQDGRWRPKMPKSTEGQRQHGCGRGSDFHFRPGYVVAYSAHLIVGRHAAVAAAGLAGRRIDPAAGNRLFDERKTRAVAGGAFPLGRGRTRSSEAAKTHRACEISHRLAGYPVIRTNGRSCRL